MCRGVRTRHPGDVAGAGQIRPDGVPGVADNRWPFAGRGKLVAQIDAALANDHVVAVLLHGPSGVGKTRLGEECVARAAAAGRPVISVVASRALAQIPLGALVALLTSRDVGVEAFADNFVRLFAHARKIGRAHV